jgi:AraC family transcriptional regulator
MIQREQSTEIVFAAARAVHIAMPPHEPNGYTSTSDPFAIGVSFTGHTHAVIEEGNGRRSERTFPPGTCAIVGRHPIKWLRVSEPAEAVEIYPSPAMLAVVAHELNVSWHVGTDFMLNEHDPVIWGTCARYRMAAMGAAPLADLEVNALVQNLLVHVAARYFGAKTPRRVRGRLDSRRLARVTALIESAMSPPPSLREMADAAAMSPFHFQRLFRRTTGLSPHAYVMARRMERARRMLNHPDAKVAQVAAELGFSDLAHFRRSFRRQFNGAPREVR